MMMRVTDSTDDSFIGKEFDDKQDPITIDGQQLVFTDVARNGDKAVFSNSNYILYAEEVR